MIFAKRSDPRTARALTTARPRKHNRTWYEDEPLWKMRERREREEEHVREAKGAFGDQEQRKVASRIR